jgi:hypothetical protein
MKVMPTGITHQIRLLEQLRAAPTLHLLYGVDLIV